MKLLVVYSVAHSSTNKITHPDGRVEIVDGPHGTYTRNMTSEYTVAHNALVGVQKVIGNAGGQVYVVSGHLSYKIRDANRAIKEHYRKGYKWVSLELHMNSTPTEYCSVKSCHERGFYGVPCNRCGAPSTKRWPFGHKCMVLGACTQAVDLTTYIDDGLSDLMPWSKAREPLVSPAPRLRDRFVTAAKRPSIVQPAVLVEGGFACEPRFAEYIDNPGNQQSYGESVAEAVLKWYHANESVPLNEWGALEKQIEIGGDKDA